MTQGSAFQWLPHASSPMGYAMIDGKRVPVHFEPAFHRFLWTMAEIKMGGVNSQSIPSLMETAAATQAAAQANADALASTVTVLQAAGTPGAGAIPPPVNVPPPVDYPPGYIIP